MIEAIPLDRIEESAMRLRSHFDSIRLKELTDDVAQRGVEVPVLVRPHLSTRGQFELVCGSRRLRAARAAGLADIPAIVRPLSDLDVLQAQIAESSPARDALHPLEEAIAFQRLLQEGLPPSQVALLIGKSPTYVYERLRLQALCPQAKEAFLQNELALATALLLCRLPSQQAQVQALGLIVGKDLTAEEANRRIRAQCLLLLKEAAFDPVDRSLGIPCTACPKNTLVQQNFFEAPSEAICLDPECYRKKTERHWQQCKAQDPQESAIVQDKAGPKLFRHGDLVSDQWVDIETLPGPTAGSLLVQDDKGRPRRVAKRSPPEMLWQLGQLVQNRGLSPALVRYALAWVRAQRGISTPIESEDSDLLGLLLQEVLQGAPASQIALFLEDA